MVQTTKTLTLSMADFLSPIIELDLSKMANEKTSRKCITVALSHLAAFNQFKFPSVATSLWT